jgi:hypothetical protein
MRHLVLGNQVTQMSFRTGAKERVRNLLFLAILRNESIA